MKGATFDRKHYKEIKAFVEHQLNNVPWCIEITCPVEWAKTFLPIVSDCIQREDFEAAKAMKDAIREFLNKFVKEPISEEAVLKL